ncbi:MAG: glutathione S-transferase family protein [Burkholderiaceae bacterium]
MVVLHYYPGNASLIPHIVLHELGVPFQLALVDRERDAQHSPEYLKLNPNGLIPVLVDGELVVYETAAICLHLVDTHAAAGLAPPVGTPERAQFYKWLVWMTNTLQARLLHYFYPERLVAPGNAAGAAEVRAQAQSDIGRMLDLLDAHMASHGGPWLLGERYGAADAFAFVLCRWTRGFGGAASRPARDRAHLGPYLQRMLQRPAVQRAIAAEQLPEPWV